METTDWIGPCYVVQAGLELTEEPRLALNSQSSCFGFLAAVTGLSHHTRLTPISCTVFYNSQEL